MSHAPARPAAPAAPQPAALALVFWMLWMSMTSGVVVIRVFIGPEKTAVEATPAPAGLFDFVGLGLLTAGLLVRWLVVPRVPGSLQRRLPFFVVGLALVEACAILAIFLAPRFQAELFVAAVLALLTMAPFFALPKTGNAFRAAK